LTFLSAYLLQIPIVEKQKVLEIGSGFDLMVYVTHLYRREVSLVGEMISRERENNQNAWLN
jgi:hypothetical protein